LWVIDQCTEMLRGKVTDIPTSLEMTVGEERNVELPGLGTAGYVWDVEIVGARVVDVHWTRGDPPGSLPPGQSAPEVASIRAVAPGDGELRLYQHRRWEPATQAIARHYIHVHVTPA
jgi:predicted secreted protein